MPGTPYLGLLRPIFVVPVRCSAAVFPELTHGEFKPDEFVVAKPDWLRPLTREMVLAWNPRLARVRRAVADAVSHFKSICRL